MNSLPFDYMRKLRELGYIVARNVFLLTNAIIVAVSVLLIVSGETRSGLFIALVLIINIVLGLFQDIRAWLTLARLQLLTAPRAKRMFPDGSFGFVLAEEIQKNDRLMVGIGDQIPCDSRVLEAHALEVNEGLITGETNSLARTAGDQVLAGSVVTAGTGSIQVEFVYPESRIARMTEGVKTYAVSRSPIQQSVENVIWYTGFLLVAVIIFVVVRGYQIHEPLTQIIKNAGALTNALVPQGLIFAMTLFFAYGAAHLFRRHVLLQEVNATEKLGRIQNLCIDKTGTLTRRELDVVALEISPFVARGDAERCIGAYLRLTTDVSQTIQAAQKFFPRSFSGQALDELMFSSWRSYGAIKARDAEGELVVLTGLPDVFLPHVSESKEVDWIKELLRTHGKAGRQIVAVARAKENSIPTDLMRAKFTLLAAFVLESPLREGIRETVHFFQERGIRIRIISGDNPETVQAVALRAGIHGADTVITGQELAHWGAADYESNVNSYSIFARIVPEEKERIVDAFKKSGFTAMVGDGANDALAIKKADLGIAMFDGAPAIRDLAAIVLTTNSFAALPGGVVLADSIICHIELFAAVFFNQMFMGFFFFLIMSALGFVYPLTPLNMTLINYFSIGMPGLLISYWVLRPSQRVTHPLPQKFLSQVMPFAACAGAIQALGAALLFAVSPEVLKHSESNIFVLIAFIIFGFSFFAVSARVYRGTLQFMQRAQILIFIIVEFLLLLFVFRTQIVSDFFEVSGVSLASAFITDILIASGLVIAFQLILAYIFSHRKRDPWKLHTRTI